MIKSRRRLLLDTLNGKCTTGSELARQLLDELDTYGPFTLTKHGYRAVNGQFVCLAIVQAWTARQTIKGLATLPQAPVAHGLHEAHVVTKDDTPTRTTPTAAEQRHTKRLDLWNRPLDVARATWDSEADGQAQHDYTQATME